MKNKVKYLFLIPFLFLTVLPVEAKTVWDTSLPTQTKSSDKIREDITPIKNKLGKTTGLNIYITLPEGLEDEVITISPNIFSAIREYKKITPGDQTEIFIKITNLSLYDYHYIEDSFSLSTQLLTEEEKENEKETDSLGFDTQKITEAYTPTRTWNSALKYLYHNEEKDQIDENLTDEKLTIQLQQKGYQGIEELDEYYLNFYNNKYHLQEKTLDKFTYATIKEIFTGPKGTTKETNSEVISLAYNYFYNKLISYSLSEKLTEENSEEYSVGSYMRNKLGNKELSPQLQTLKSKTFKNLTPMALQINSLYMTTTFMDYNLKGHIEWRLEREGLESEAINTGLIIPPDTGIE